jgi:two-component system, OmpR family, response regulator MprA
VTAAAEPRVLLVDDDTRLLTALRRALSLKGFEVETAKDAGEALRFIEQRWGDVIVLDVMMPVVDGITLCRLIRDRVQSPILMLTALDSVPDRVAGLEAGADDYLTKPFATEELIARIQALLRRARPEQARIVTLTFEDVALNTGTWEASRAGKRLPLTSKEFRILDAFMRNPDRVLTREDILSAAWQDEEAVESNVVDVHVASLRNKLEADGASRVIQTIRGVGYALRAE